MVYSMRRHEENAMKNKKKTRDEIVYAYYKLLNKIYKLEEELEVHKKVINEISTALTGKKSE